MPMKNEVCVLCHFSCCIFFAHVFCSNFAAILDSPGGVFLAGVCAMMVQAAFGPLLLECVDGST